MFFASDGGVFKTTDGGNTFVGLNGGYVTSQFYQGFANSGANEDLAMGGMQDNLTAIYEGTVAWRRVIGGDGSWAAVNAKNDMTLFGSYQNLNLLRSYDGGTSWTEIPPPVLGGEATAFIAPFVSSPSDTSILYAGRSRVYRSANQGSNWSVTNAAAPLDGSNVVFTMAISATDPDVVYAATAPGAARGRVFRTRNGGGIWDDITGSLPDRYLSDLAVDPRDDRKVLVTLMGFGSSHVFSSADGGDTWVDIGSGLPDVPASAVEVDPHHSSILYVGTDLGAFVSPDYGHSWFPFMRGMPTAMVNDLKVFAPGRKIRAATHGNGVFERDLVDPVQLAVEGDDPGVAPRIGLRVVPNPLRATGSISFRLDEAVPVRLALFDVSGRRIALLLEEHRGAGQHTVPLDRGSLSRGVYFLRLQAGERTAVTRLVLV
jgi:photosystem II stability/assembly factor-like uncharacterized protein